MERCSRMSHSSRSRGRIWVNCWLVTTLVLGQQATLYADDPCGCEAALAKNLGDCKTDWDACAQAAQITADTAHNACARDQSNAYAKALIDKRTRIENNTIAYLASLAGCLALGFPPAQAACAIPFTIAYGAFNLQAQNDYSSAIDKADADRQTCDDKASDGFKRESDICDVKKAACEKKAQDAHKTCAARCVAI